MKKDKGIIHCAWCGGASKLLELTIDWGTFPVQMPVTHPEITRWCDGLCDSVMIGMWHLVDDLKKRLPAGSKKTIQWADKEMKRISSEMKKIMKERSCRGGNTR